MAVTFLERRPIATEPLGNDSLAPAEPQAPSVTTLSGADENAFRRWMVAAGQTREAGQAVDENFNGKDYDYRGFYKKYGPVDVQQGQHFTDEFKLPNHETFSNESIYAVGPNAARAGHWEGEGDTAKFVPPTPAPQRQIKLVARRPIGSPDEDLQWSDYGRMAMSGLAQMGAGLGWMLEKFGQRARESSLRMPPGGFDKEGRPLDIMRKPIDPNQPVPGEIIGKWLKGEARSAADEWINNNLDGIGITENGISPVARRALEVDFLGQGSWGDKWNKAKLTAAGSLPATAAGMGAGGIIAKGLAAAGAGATSAAAVGYGLGEALTAAPIAGAQVDQQIMEMPLEELMKSPEYQATYEALSGLEPAARSQKARELLASAAAGNAAAMDFVATFVLSAPAGAILTRTLRLKPRDLSRTMTALKEGSTEAAQEFLQSGAEQLAQNQAMRDAGFDVPIWNDVLEQAVGGALSGAPLGAAMGFSSPERAAEGEDKGPAPDTGLRRPGEPPPPAEEIPPVNVPPGGPGGQFGTTPEGSVPAETILGDEEGEIPQETAEKPGFSAQNPQEQPPVANTNGVDPRLSQETYRGGLQGLAGELTPGGGVAYIKDEHGKITSRTPSQNPEWFQAMNQDSAHRMSVKRVKNLVDKAIAGETLTPKEQRVVGYMLDQLDAERADEARRAGVGAGDRRQDLGRRRAVAEMSPAEMRAALLTDATTGLPNRRAYEERTSKLPVTAAIDSDGLGWVNSVMGHEAGDELIRVIGEAIRNNVPADRAYQAFHLSGDEFILEANTEEEAHDALEAVRERLAQQQLEVTLKDGTVITLDGVDISYGLGGDFTDADRQLATSKKERQAQGLRAKKGEQPPSATVSRGGRGRESPEGREDQVQAPDEQGETDLAGPVSRQAQDLADEQRRRDEARSPNKDVSLETGRPDDLFSESRKQIEITDATPRRKVQEQPNERQAPAEVSAAPAEQPAAAAPSEGAAVRSEAPAVQPEAAAGRRVTPSANKVFTDDAAEKARALLRSKLGQLNAGVDPEVLQAGITLAGYHIEKGARTFAAYSKAMIEDLGEAIRPYLKSWYMAVKYDPRAAEFQAEMDSAADVEKADVAAPAAPAQSQAQIDAAAHEAATSPENKLPLPSQAQKEANGEGNYKLGAPVKLYGVTWRVENPKGSYRTNLPTNELEDLVGSYRRGRKALLAYKKGDVPEAFNLLRTLAGDIKGNQAVADKLVKLMNGAWFNLMPAHYARGDVQGADGDKLDAFLGPNASDETLPVYVIDTNKLSDGTTFDEHKVMIGFPTEGDALGAFMQSYEAGIGGRIFAGMRQLTPDEFRAWAQAESKKPLSPQAQPTAELLPRGQVEPAKPKLPAISREEEIAAIENDLQAFRRGEEPSQTVPHMLGENDEPGDYFERATARLEELRGTAPSGKKVIEAEPAESDTVKLAKKFEAAYAELKYSEESPFRSIIQARRYAAEVLGREVKSGTPDAKLVDEALELGVTLRARAIVQKGLPAGETYAQLVELYEKMPRLGTRTSTSVAEQAYSTPIPLAYIAARAAGITSKSTVFEPSAGNGALLITADPKNVIANELNAEREASLRATVPGASITNHDAVHWRPRKQVDVVIGNPPFGAVKDAAGKTIRYQVNEEYDTGEIDHAISLKALESMKDDGAAVLIVGSINKLRQGEESRSDAYNSKAKREFYLTLYRDYHVVDHFTVPGELYEKQGAGWPVDVIVIRGRGKSDLPVPAVQPPRSYDSWEALAGVLGAQYEGSASSLRPPVRESDLGQRGPASSDGGNGSRGGEGGADRQRVESPQGQPGDVRPGPVGGQPAGAGSAEPVAREPSQARPSVELDRRPRRVAVVPEGTRQVPYKPASSAPGMGTLVPVNMQTATQEALDHLSARVGNIENYVAERLGYKPDELADYFGAEQIDALALGLDNLERGAGFIIGDQTGIGKGRVVAAVIRYAMRAKRTPIFVTEKPNLYGDMYRDLTDIGIQKMLGREPEILMTNAAQNVPLDEEGNRVLKSGSASEHNALLDRIAGEGHLANHDMVFTTYSQMQTLKGDVTARMRFLEAMANGGIVIFDESHNAGGSVQQQKPGDKELLNRSTFARRLAQIAHGVFYSSATYAKRPEVMDLYASTDMRLAVSDISTLAEAIQKGGVPMQQVVAAMLAQAGQYMRRERSFDGIVYNAPVVNVSRKTYADYSNALASIQKFSENFVPPATKRLDKELKAEGKSISPDGSTGGAGAQSTNFTSVMHNLIDQMLLSITADAAATRAIEAIKNGEKPVITVANTMGSFIEDFVDGYDVKPGDHVAIDFNSLLDRYLDRTRWITLRKPFSKGPGEKLYLDDEMIGPLGVRVFEETRAAIRAMDFAALPVSPIDHIRQRLHDAGYKIGEITGRKHTLDYRKGGPFYRVRPNNETSIRGRRNTIAAFNRGDLDAMVINQAGSTGLSLHASEKFKDQRKRRMILAQAEKNIDTHMQMLGRVNRTGQVVLPEYDQLVADVPAVKRPAAVLSKKMASLNANTTASRSHALKAENVPDFMNQYGDEIAARLMQDNPEIHEALSEPLEEEGDGYSTEDAARKVTGRIPLLPIEEQERIYEALESEYEELLAQKTAAGESILEARTLDLDAKVLDRQQVIAPQGIDSPFADGVYVETVDVKRLGKPHTTAEVLGMVAAELGIPVERLSADDMSVADVRGRAAASKTMADAEDRAAVYRMEALDSMASPEGRAQAQARLDSQLARFRELMGVAFVGNSIRLQTQAGNYYGVVTKVEQRGKPKNPLALGSWKVTMAMADSSRRLTLPMSQLDVALTVGDVSLTRSTIMPAKNITDEITVIRAFDELQTEAREKRTIVTGNLLAGFEHVNQRGSIINFSDAEGGVRQGIFMPRGYDYAKAREDLPVPLRNADQVLEFVRTGNDVQSTDRAVTIKQQGDGLRIEVQQSKSAGGQYYLNRAVLNALGQDFVSVSGKMRADISDAQANTVIEALKRAGAAFQATENLKIASQIAGRSAAADPNTTAGDDSIELLIGDQKEKGQGIGVTAAKKFVERLTARWRNIPARLVVTTRREMAGVPDHLKEALERRDPRRTSRGMHVPSTHAVYIFADNMTSKAQLARTVVHEILGHYAAYTYFGERYQMVAEFIMRTFPKKAMEIARGYGADMRTTQGRNIVTNETIAWIATEMEAGTATQRMKNAFERFVLWLNRNLQALFGTSFQLTQMEARDLIRQASRWVRDGAPRRARTPAAAAINLAYENVPDSLMGFRKNGPNKGFDAERYPFVQPVRVHWDSGELRVMEDAIKGLNQKHALERARRNWPTASKIEPIGRPIRASEYVDPDLDQPASPGRVIDFERQKWLRLQREIDRMEKFAKDSAAIADAYLRELTDIENDPELNLMLGLETQRHARAMVSALKKGLVVVDGVLSRTGKGQPLDRVFRIPFTLFGTINEQGEFRLSPRYKTFALRAVRQARAMMASPRLGWLRHTAAMAHANLIKQYGIDDKFTHALETAKRGLIDRYGLSKEYIERDLRRQADERGLLMEGKDVLKQLADEGVGNEEAATLYRMLSGGDVTDAHMAGLAVPIRGAIDAMGAEAVELGLLSAESYERNRGAYLHRSYKHHEANRTSLAKWASEIMQTRRRKIIGNQFKGRGLWLRKSMDRVLRDVPEEWWGRRKKKDRADAELLGKKFRVFDQVSAPGEGTIDAPDIAPKTVKERVLKRIYWPADLPVPSKLAVLEHRGIFEVRDIRGGELVLWRDFTPEERARMGEIVDARYAIAKTYMQMAHDLATGRFFRDIASNPEWASKTDPTGESPEAEDTRFKLYADAPWVRVPQTKIPQSNTYRYGALAGMWVRSEIWRDMVEIGRMQKAGFWREIMKQWKLNKTARNPVVHFNNIMSNIMLMDMIDVRAQDFVRGLRSFVEKDEHYKSALQHGAFGADIMSQEIRDTVLKPILKDIEGAALEQSRTGLWAVATRVLSAIKSFDQFSRNTYQLEDELFRMATYIRKTSLGLTPEEAARITREQFLNYDIRAPWVNAMRETVLPFIAYTYRAVPIIASSLADRPWKLAKYFTLAYMLNALGYLIAGDDDEDEERATLRPEEQGRTWTGVFRMIRTPFNDDFGNPIFLDTRRFVPAGDVFDMNQGSSALSIPAPVQFGGPLMIAAEFMLNKQGFTGEEIRNELTDTPGEATAKVADWLWKSAAPSAPWIPGSWYYSKIKSAWTGELDPMMREYSVPLALANSFGLKLKPHDVTLNRQYALNRFDAVERALNTQLNQLARDYSRRRIDLDFYQSEVQKINAKRMRLAEQRRELAPE